MNDLGTDATLAEAIEFIKEMEPIQGNEAVGRAFRRMATLSNCMLVLARRLVQEAEDDE